MEGDWADVELEQARARIHREDLEQLSRRPAEDAEKLSDEELFALDFKAYGARLELRRAQQRDAVLKRYKVPGDLFHFVKLAQDSALRDVALEVFGRYGALPKEVFDLVHALADPTRHAQILQLAATLDCPALDQDLYEIWANQPRLNFCSNCRAIGYWKALSKQQCFRQLCDTCAAEDRERRMKHALRDFSSVLSGARSRARAAKLPATLTKKQWLATLQYFEYRCSYCDEIPWEVIEHVTPIKHGGGTTWNNCLPACFSCNGRKEGQTIEELPLGDFVGFNTNVIGRALAWLQQHGRDQQGEV